MSLCVNFGFGLFKPFNLSQLGHFVDAKLELESTVLNWNKTWNLPIDMWKLVESTNKPYIGYIGNSWNCMWKFTYISTSVEWSLFVDVVLSYKCEVHWKFIAGSIEVYILFVYLFVSKQLYYCQYTICSNTINRFDQTEFVHIYLGGVMRWGRGLSSEQQLQPLCAPEMRWAKIET